MFHAIRKIRTRRLPAAVLALTVAAAVAAVAVGCGTTEKDIEKIPTPAKDTLYVYNAGEYIDPELIDQFEEETGINVVYDVFETLE